MRERSEANEAEAGERCDLDAGESELCMSESERDAQIGEIEPDDMDAALPSTGGGASTVAE